MHEDKTPFWRELLPHAAWDVIKWLLVILGSTLITLIAKIYQMAMHLRSDWWALGGLFAVAVVVISFLFFLKGRLEITRPGIQDTVDNRISNSKEPQRKEPTITSGRRPDIQGYFYNAKVVRHGLITEELDTKQQWMTCGLAVSVSLMISGRDSVCITDIRLQTHKDKPHVRTLPPIVPFLTVKLGEENGTVKLQAFPEIEYPYEGKRTLPQSLEVVLSDEFGREHLIYLKEGETLPNLPREYSAPKVVIVGETIDRAGKVSITFKNIGNATAQNVAAKKWIVAGGISIHISDPSFVAFIPRFDTKNEAYTDGATRTLEPGAEYVFSCPEDFVEKSEVEAKYPESVIRICGEISYTYGAGSASLTATFWYEPKLGPNGWMLERCPELGTTAFP